MGNEVTIVVYHYVREQKTSRYPAINALEPDMFRKQLRYFKKHYHVISLKDLIRALEGESQLPKNALLLTFNDCFSDHYRTVFPELLKHSVSGAFFPEIQPLKEREIILNHKIHHILACVENVPDLVQDLLKLLKQFREEYDLEDGSYYQQKYSVASSYDPAEVVFVKRLLQSGLDFQLSHKISDILLDTYCDASREVLHHEIYMNDDQIRCMIQNGMDFGMIGYSHKRLTDVNPDQLEYEIDASKKHIIELGQDPSFISMSYPWGETNEAVVSALKKAGCKVAFTSEERIADIQSGDRYRLPRFDTNYFINLV